MIIRPPCHPSHLCQDPDSIWGTFLEQFVLVLTIPPDFQYWNDIQVTANQSRAKISQCVRNWRPTSHMDWKNWTTLQRKAVKLFELNNFFFSELFNFSICLAGRPSVHCSDGHFFSTFWNFCTVTILWIFNVKKYVKKLPDDWANFFILVLEIGRKATPYEWPKQPTYLCT